MAFDNIKLDKSLYTTSKGFTKSLEELDPSENYIGTEFEGLDAFERQLRRFDIKVSGDVSGTVFNFFQNRDSAVLFPEYVARAVASGMQKDTTIKNLIATNSQIDTYDYRSIKHIVESQTPFDDKIVLTESLVKLKKYGRRLLTSYEAIKYQRLDVFTIMLRQVGKAIISTQLDDLISLICANKDVKVHNLKDLDSLKYMDLISSWNNYNNLTIYNLTTLLFNANFLNKLFDSREALELRHTENFNTLIAPLGVEMYSNLKSSNLEDKIIGIDKTVAIEKVRAGSLNVDYDNLINRNFENCEVSIVEGFSICDPNAIQIFTI